MIAFELKPGLAHSIEIENSLKALQDYVGGYIEVVTLAVTDKIAMIINEEGKLSSMDRNVLATRIYQTLVNPNDFIAGNALIVGVRRDAFVSLTDKQVGNLLSICMSFKEAIPCTQYTT